jgi:hypothetical protein
LDTDSFLDLFASIPHLKRLAIACKYIVDDLLEAISTGLDHDGGLLPHLTSFKFSEGEYAGAHTHAFTESALLQMLQSRTRHESMTGFNRLMKPLSADPLESVDICYLDPLMPEILMDIGSLRSSGLQVSFEVCGTLRIAI